MLLALKSRCRPDHQIKQIVQPERCRNTDIATLPPHANRRRCLRPMPHRVGGGTVRRVAVAYVHAALVLHRPGDVAIQPTQACLHLPINCRVGTSGIKPHDINIAHRRCHAIIVQAVPHRVTHKTRTHPAIRQIKRCNHRQNPPPAGIGTKDSPKPFAMMRTVWRISTHEVGQEFAAPSELVDLSRRRLAPPGAVVFLPSLACVSRHRAGPTPATADGTGSWATTRRPRTPGNCREILRHPAIVS